MTIHPNKASRPSNPHNRRGAVYVAVLAAASIALLIVLAGFASARIERRTTLTALDVRDATLHARSGIELALEHINTDPAWRDSPTGMVSWDDGDRSVTVSAGAIGTGAFPADACCEPFSIGSVAFAGDARQFVSLLVSPEPEPEASDLIRSYLPVAYWPMRTNDRTIATVPDDRGIAEGTRFGTADYDGYAHGQCVGALTFRGAGYAVIPHRANLSPEQGTIAMWVRLDTVSGNQTLFSKASTESHKSNLTIWFHDAHPHFKIDGLTDLQKSADLVVAGKWHHLAFTFGERGMETWIDGSLWLSDTGKTAGLGVSANDNGTMNTQPIVLGMNGDKSASGGTDSLYDPFSGSLRDVALFAYQLEPAQIRALAAETPQPRRFVPVRSTFTRRVTN